MIKLYGHELSGNSYKVRLFLEILQISYEWINVDLMQSAHKSPTYLAINPFGQVPTLVDGELQLGDAQAILVYLARQYGGDGWLPREPVALAQVIRWLSITAGEVRQGPESARLYHLFGVTSINIERAYQRSQFILTQLDQHLKTHSWLEMAHPTIADIAIFPYVALARDGQVNLDDYPHILTWIERVKQLPNFTPMTGI
ncbi:glutathione S-transferase domain-containing protein [Gloeomargarita lithophora Alchichica-D10]|uniref:Glutathione S-transferase domain-containing protein n=1 Tax=Gloeomargarita lithophora Alchichica-D10 TaxID=1188229 RepID=A0A1J0AFR7_9CYAN|nr:glutathione S-transferase [Gloeomargarita lithophora]APB34778.1 glutathione S-transferase domain-containing protein [Gloeomargarita lithophora Alchichica-D10]